MCLLMNEDNEFVGILPALRCLRRVKAILLHNALQSRKIERPKPEFELLVAFFLQCRKHIRNFARSVLTQRGAAYA